MSPRRKYWCGIECLMLSKQLFSKLFSICTRRGAIISTTIAPLTNSYLERQDIAHEEHFNKVKFRATLSCTDWLTSAEENELSESAHSH